MTPSLLRSGLWAFRSTILLCVLVACMVLSAGCGRHGPESTDRTSADVPLLKERVAFLQRYVSFRRTYEALDFAIAYRNGEDGMVPSPSEWDIRLVATVPASEIAAWIPANVPTSTVNPDWLKSVPTLLDLSGVTEWYVDGQRVVGVDRTRRVIVYRNHCY